MMLTRHLVHGRKMTQEVILNRTDKIQDVTQLRGRSPGAKLDDVGV
jgi:hypothetical protein